MLIDSHCHLDFHKFKSIGFKDYSEERHSTLPVLQRAKNAGVSHILAIGTTLDDSEENVNIATEMAKNNSVPKIFAAVGIHPDHAIDYENVNYVINTLQNLAKNKEVVCIGECGIDYRNGKETRQIQMKMFEAQCDLAKKLENTPYRTEIISNIEDYSQTYKLIMFEDLNCSCTLNAGGADLLKPGDSVQVQILNNHIYDIKRH
jgi:Tat protein secretion system quality control protein TatD with DNase activity